MHAQHLSWNASDGWSPANLGGDRDLVLYFGTRSVLEDGERFQELRRRFPGARLVGCSTGGQISDDGISDDDVAAVTLRFEATPLRIASAPVPGPERSRDCGEAIGQALRADDLAGIFILSDGLNVNGSELVAGITDTVGRKVPLTGGLAGDGAKFEETLVGADCPPASGIIAAVGFYGSAVRFGHGSAGGWDEFGPRRRVTRSRGNVLYKLDGEPALDLYERYLGEEEAKELPGAGLLFPLLIRDPQRSDSDVVRTILAIDRTARSMTFAGDVPEGWVAQLMRGNFDRLAAGAADAAGQARSGLGNSGDRDGVAVLVSCIGRRLLMGQRTAEEIEAAGLELGPHLARVGFYSYGEISPHAASGVCQLHNQTMTVTAITEEV
jgi:hypothetical protein